MSAIAIASGGSALTPATGNIILFVSTLGSDSNDGSAAHPFATIQHAVNVAATYAWQRFTPTISVANGTYHETVNLPFLYGATNPNFTQSSNGGQLTGNSATPTNCVVAPNDATGNDAIAATDYSKWAIDGFSLKADPVSGTGTMVHARTYSFVNIVNLDINTNTAGGVTNTVFEANTYSRLQCSSGTQTFQGSAGFPGGFILQTFQGSIGAFGGATWTFNSAQTIPGGTTILAQSQGLVAPPGTFVNPGNLTGASAPLNAFLLGAFVIGADPTTITWPGAAFTAVGAFDGTGDVDGFIYATEFAGSPVDHSSIYRGSWQIHKDSNQTTAGLGLNLYVDDAGTVVPLIALTPAPGNLTFFVATTGSDSNPGTSGSPFRTIQHAVSFALSFDYQSLYTCTINIANGTYNENVSVLGLFNGSTNVSIIPFSIIGNTTTPTNCKIAPTSGANSSVIAFFNGNFSFDGFSLVGDPSASPDNLLFVNNYAIVTIPTALDLNINTTASYTTAIRGQNWARLRMTPTSITINGSGWGNAPTSLIFANRWSNISTGSNFVFNSSWNLAGNPVFNASFDCVYQLSGITFTNPGNVTGGTPFQLLDDSILFLLADPTSITWPSGPFDTTQIDGSSPVDGFLYSHTIAGQAVDQTSIYRGSWIIYKDTTNVRRYLAYNDGGTIYAKQIGRVPNTQSGTPYVLALSDQDGRVEMNNAGANQLTVPANATVAFPIGTEVRVVQVGAGATTIAGAVGVTVDAAGVVGGQWKSVMLYKRGTNEWVQTNV